MGRLGHYLVLISMLVSKITYCKALMCYTCINGRSESDCSYKKEVCGVDQEMCYTEIRNSGSGVSIMKSCYQSQACATLAGQNSHECPRVCSLCCRGNLCNKRGPPECNCNLVSLVGLPSTTRKPTTRRTTRKTKPRRRRTTTLAPTTAQHIEPKTCEETSFVPIPETSGSISCTNIEDHQFNVCQLIPGNPDDFEGIRHFYVALSDSSTSRVTYHQCQHGLEGAWANISRLSDELSVEEPLVLLCINMTASHAAVQEEAGSEDVKKSEFGPKPGRVPSAVHINCIVDDMSIMKMFNESMFDDFGSTLEPQEDNVMASEQGMLEMKSACKDRIFSMQCHLTATAAPPTIVETTTADTTTPIATSIPTTVEETTYRSETTAYLATQAEQLVKAAKLPTWGVFLIVVGCVFLGILLLVILIRQVGRKGFYLIHKKKVTPTHGVKA